MRSLMLFALGALFAAGLTLGGMTDPANVIAFLDFGGAWNPSLLFVMGGAVMVYGVAYRLIGRTRAPWWGGALLRQESPVPRSSWREPRLLLGLVLFGVGWGLGGYCPGPAWASLGAGISAPRIVLGAMLVGIALGERIR